MRILLKTRLAGSSADLSGLQNREIIFDEKNVNGKFITIKDSGGNIIEFPNLTYVNTHINDTSIHFTQANITTVGTVTSGTWNASTIGIGYGGTGQTTAQAAIDALTQVSGATNEYVLTKDTGTGSAVWKVIPTAPVTSVFGRTGDITATSGDYNAGQITVTPTGNLSSITVQDGLVELQGDINNITTSLSGLTSAVVLKGLWDASTGVFPGAGSAIAGWSYIVNVGGTVDGVVFNVNDRLLAITDNASTTTFTANWHKLDYTDQVLSVYGRTGAVTSQSGDYNLDQITQGTTNKYLSSTEYTDLTDAGDSTLHYHASDRDLANATGILSLAKGGTNADLSALGVGDDGKFFYFNNATGKFAATDIIDGSTF